MEMNKQVACLDLSRILKEQGVKQTESAFIYDMKGNLVLRALARWDMLYCVAAFTVAELGEMFPYVSCLCYTCFLGSNWVCIYATEYHEGALKVEYETSGATEADARANMLIYLIEKGIVKP